MYPPCPHLPERGFRCSRFPHKTLMTALVFALLKYGKGKERERAAFNNLGNGNLPQDREASAGYSTLSGQGNPGKSFGRASGRKVKAGVSGTSSMPTASDNTPSTSSRLVPGPRPSSQPPPLRNSRTSADTITYDLLPLFAFVAKFDRCPG